MCNTSMTWKTKIYKRRYTTGTQPAHCKNGSKLEVFNGEIMFVGKYLKLVEALPSAVTYKSKS